MPRAARKPAGSATEPDQDTKLYHHPFVHDHGWLLGEGENIRDGFGKPIRVWNMSKYVIIPTRIQRNVMPDLGGTDCKVLDTLLYWYLHHSMRDPATGEWRKSFEMSGARLADEAGAGINSCMESVDLLAELGFITVTRSKGRVHSYTVNLEALKKYKRGTYVRTPDEDFSADSSDDNSASVKMGGTGKAAKRGGTKAGPHLVETPAAGEPVRETIAAGESIEVEVQGTLEIVNESAARLTATLQTKEDGTGSVLVLSVLAGGEKGEQEANHETGPNEPSVRQETSYTETTSPKRVEVLTEGVIRSEAATAPVSRDEEAAFKAFKSELKAKMDADEYDIGLGRATFVQGRTQTARVWTVAVPDRHAVDFLRDRTVRCALPADVEIQYWVEDAPPEAPPEAPPGKFEQDLRALPNAARMGMPGSEFFKGLAAQRHELEHGPLIEFLQEKLTSSGFANKREVSWGLLHSYVEEYRYKTILGKVSWFAKYLDKGKSREQNAD